jgi:hypothetical protein
VAFETIAVLDKARFGAVSLERPALVVADDDVSCATSGSAHWRVDLVEASSPAGLADGDVATVLPGSQQVAVKDPVVVRAGGCWHLWASCHPLTDPQQADRMTTAYATSEDGVHWTWWGTALRGRPGSWDQRGVRVTAVLLDGATPVAYYDGRASAAQNFEEQTGVAVGASQFGTFRAVGQAPVVRAVDEGADRVDEVLDAGEGPAADRLPGDDAEEHLEEVEPGARGGREVQGDPGVLASHACTAGCLCVP